jgi:hypothetical protein
MTTRTDRSAYQLILAVGAVPPELADLRVIELTAKEASPGAVLESLAASGLTPSDVRARTLITFDPLTPVPLAILMYTAVSGFAGRYPDALASDVLIAPAPLLRATATMHAERPEGVPGVVLIGAPHSELSYVLLDHPLTSEESLCIRWAKRARFVPDSDIVAALNQYIVVCALRNRNAVEHLPYLCEGNEPFDPEAPLAIVGADLDALRKEALSLRRHERSGDRDTIVDALVPTLRDTRLQAAAEVPIEEALLRLGARQNPDTGYYHCPRPSRHTHGDATASMRITDKKTICYRCDAAPVDSLRLVIDVSGVSVDEAADWLLEAPAL